MSTRRDDRDGGLDTIDRPGTTNATATKPRTERPPLYKVLLHNDDYTPVELVIHVLQVTFRMTPEQAWQVMSTAHTTGLCLCGVFTHEIAEQKVIEATDLGRKHGAALRFTTERE